MVQQMLRLKQHFGEKAFSDEFITLACKEISGMPENSVKRMVDVFIGARPYNKPPLIMDFRDAKLAEAKQKLQKDLAGATSFLIKRSPQEMRMNLQKVLSKEFGGLKNVSEAIDIARMRIRTEVL